MLKILTVPEATEILRQKSRPILKFDEELAAFLKELGETLRNQKDPDGVGLSAIQVGKPIRVFATYLPKTEVRSQKSGVGKNELTFYINPEITEHAAEMTLGEELVKSEKLKVKSSNQRIDESTQQPFLEGCLSIPQIYGPVLRWPWVKVKYQILSGGEVSDTLHGLPARVFQHELDHLNGILFTDRVLAQGNKLYREQSQKMIEMEM